MKKKIPIKKSITFLNKKNKRVKRVFKKALLKSFLNLNYRIKKKE